MEGSCIAGRIWYQIVTRPRYVTGLNVQEGTFLILGNIDRTIGRAMCDNYDPNKCQTVSEMLARLGDKWTVLVIMMLGDGPQRFSDLKRSVVGISQRMLTLTLRALERDGIVERTVHPTVPPKVEYALSDRGRSLRCALVPVADWVMEHREGIEESQTRFDSETGKSF